MWLPSVLSRGAKCPKWALPKKPAPRRSFWASRVFAQKGRRLCGLLAGSLSHHGFVYRSPNRVRIGNGLIPAGHRRVVLFLAAIIVGLIAHQNPAVALRVEDEAKAENIYVRKNVGIPEIAAKVRPLSDFPSEAALETKGEIESSRSSKFLRFPVGGSNNPVRHRRPTFFDGINGRWKASSDFDWRYSLIKIQNIRRSPSVVGKTKFKLVASNVLEVIEDNPNVFDFYDHERRLQLGESAFLNLGGPIVGAPQQNVEENQKSGQPIERQRIISESIVTPGIAAFLLGGLCAVILFWLIP